MKLILILTEYCLGQEINFRFLYCNLIPRRRSRGHHPSHLVMNKVKINPKRPCHFMSVSTYYRSAFLTFNIN